MRITDLLDKRSISLTGAPRSKQEALDQMVDLMIQSGKINDREHTSEVYRRKRKAPPASAKASPSPRQGPLCGTPGLAAMVVKTAVDFDFSGREPVT